MGGEPCFADTVICVYLQFMRNMVREKSEESFTPYEKLL